MVVTGGGARLQPALKIASPLGQFSENVFPFSVNGGTMSRFSSGLPLNSCWATSAAFFVSSLPLVADSMSQNVTICCCCWTCCFSCFCPSCFEQSPPL